MKGEIEFVDWNWHEICAKLWHVMELKNEY